MPTWITDLITLFAPLILDCFKRDKAKAIERLRKLEGVDAVRARRGLRKQGVPFRELDDRISELRSQLAEAEDDDLLEVANMASAMSGGSPDEFDTDQ